MPDIITDLSSTPDMIAWRIAKTTYVILVKHEGKLNLIVDPGLNRPWSTKNKKYADIVAQEAGGEARTYEDALALLIKDNPGFTKVLHDRIAEKANILDAAKAKENAKMIGDVLAKGQTVLPPVPKNDVNPINPAY